MNSNIIAFSCFLPGILGYFTFKRMDKKAHPFVYCIWLACLVEVLAFSGDKAGIPLVKSISYNLYIIINMAFMLWFFILTKTFSKKKAIIAFASIVIANLIELMVVQNNEFITITSVLESFLIVIGCVQLISSTILSSKDKLFTNFYFLISFATIILFLFDILDSLLGYVVLLNRDIHLKISYIFKTVNGCYYIFIAYAIYCLAWKKK